MDLLFVLFAGIALALAFMGFMIAANRKTSGIYLTYGIFSLFAGAYFLLELYPTLFLVQILCAAVYYALFPWFVNLYCNARISRRYLIGISSIFAFAYILLLSGGQDSGNTWQIIAHLGLLASIVISFVGTAALRRVKPKEALVFGLLSTLFGLLAIEEISSDHLDLNILDKLGIDFLLLDVYPLMFAVVIGVRLGKELLEKDHLSIEILENQVQAKDLRIKVLESEKLKRNLRHKDHDISDLGVQIGRKDLLLNQLQNRLQSLHNGSEKKDPIVNELISDIRAHLDSDKTRQVFQGSVNKVNHRFRSELKTKYPALTNNDLDLAGLLRLRLSSKDIAVIKNIAPGSAKVMRSRLRSKLELAKDQNLTEFLNTFKA